ncbi:MAG: hypothetical protein ABTQ32_18620 [Myxococcaceae bacterium]
MTTPFARSGPLWPMLGVVNAAEWNDAATWLEHELQHEANRDLRIHWLIVPLALWLKQRSTQRSPLMVGLNAPQGAGKTTLTRNLVGVFAHVFGLRAVSLSVDDFYLRREEQLALATRHPGNRYLEHRGYPGTHDVALGASVLAALRDGRDVALPRYDKSAHGGRGDRSADVSWVRGRVDLVLLEGWMLGFKPVAAVEDTALAAPNELLRAYDAWDSLLDVFIALRMQRVEQVVRWRIEAEQAMRASGRPALSDAEVEDYVRRFLPAYELWRAEAELSVTLDAERRPTPGHTS